MTNRRKGLLIPSEIFNAMSAILYLSRTAGFFPTTFTKAPAGYYLVWSRKISTYSYVFAISLVSFAIYGLTRLYQIEAVAAIRLAQTSGTICTILEISWLLLTSLVGTFLTPVSFKHLWTYLDCITKVDLLLGKQNQKVQRCNLVALLTLIATLVVVVLDFFLWSKVISRDMSFLEYLGNVAALYLTYIYVMIREIYFWALVDAIRVRLRCLNDILLEILKDKEIHHHQYFSNSNEYISKHLVRTVKVCRNTEEKVKKIILAHDLLFQASGCANDHLGIFTLVILLGCVIHLLVTPYDLYLLIKDTKNYAFIGGQLVWMLGHVSRLIFIIEPCHACKRQVQHTTALISRLLPLERSREAVLQLKSLMMQLDRCHVEFSACDLIYLDRTLLTTITGTVTTYLVILFQFK